MRTTPPRCEQVPAAEIRSMSTEEKTLMWQAEVALHDMEHHITDSLDLIEKNLSDNVTIHLSDVFEKFGSRHATLPRLEISTPDGQRFCMGQVLGTVLALGDRPQLAARLVDLAIEAVTAMHAAQAREAAEAEAAPSAPPPPPKRPRRLSKPTTKRNAP